MNIPNCNCWHMYCGQEVSDMSWVGDGKTCNEGNRIGDRVLIEWSKDGFLAWMGLNSKGCIILQGLKLYEGTQNDVKRSLVMWIKWGTKLVSIWRFFQVSGTKTFSKEMQRVEQFEWGMSSCPFKEPYIKSFSLFCKLHKWKVQRFLANKMICIMKTLLLKPNCKEICYNAPKTYKVFIICIYMKFGILSPPSTFLVYLPMIFSNCLAIVCTK